MRRKLRRILKDGSVETDDAETDTGMSMSPDQRRHSRIAAAIDEVCSKLGDMDEGEAEAALSKLEDQINEFAASCSPAQRKSHVGMPAVLRSHLQHRLRKCGRQCGCR